MNDLQPKLRLTICRTPSAASLSREEIVRLLAAEMGQGDSAFAEAVATSALAREAVESTYVGRGLAVPHARLAGLTQPCVCLASTPGVDWSGGQATLIALLAVPEEQPEWHLRLLGVLARYVSAHGGETDLPGLAAALQQKTA
ncbi:MAG: PTS sugar transporter subunit IIA [Akkermansia sp.]|nr:PTS sugar transporter subunit IIA [Akkermansia sp.]